MKQVCIVDDDIEQLKFLTKILNKDFQVEAFSNPLVALDKFKSIKLDAVIVDVHMPYMDGFELISSMKKFKEDIPLFLLSSDSSTQTKLKALSLGVNDFLWPEMSKEEIILRINNQLNLSRPDEIRYKELILDKEKQLLFYNDEQLDLTKIEFKILLCLIANANSVIEKDDFIKFVWGEQLVLEKTINTHLSNLRSKLKNSEIQIKSIKGSGIFFS